MTTTSIAGPIWIQLKHLLPMMQGQPLRTSSTLEGAEGTGGVVGARGEGGDIGRDAGVGLELEWLANSEA